jgi:hypothetical protein
LKYPIFQEIEPLNGVLLSVHGDGANSVREQILNEVQLCSYSALPLEDILALASIRALRSAIKDESRRFIGGQIQACLLSKHVAEHLVCEDNTLRFLRSAPIEDFDGCEYGTLNLGHQWLDLSRPLKDLINSEVDMLPLITAPSRRDWRSLGI